MGEIGSVCYIVFESSYISAFLKSGNLRIAEYSCSVVMTLLVGCP